MESPPDEITQIENFVTKMYLNDKTQSWTHFGSGLYDIPVTIHKKLFRGKFTTISKIVNREYNLYQGQAPKVLETELKLYRELLSGRPSILSRSLSLIALVLSLLAVIFSLTSGSERISLITTLFPYIVAMVVLLLVVGIIALGQDRLSVREHHIRIIVLSYLLTRAGLKKQ